MSRTDNSDSSRIVIGSVRECLAKHRIQNEPVLVAVSGGPDSTALLLALVEILGAPQVAAAHLNHQLRGEESEADEQFVRRLCEQLGVPLCVQRRDIGQLARQARDNLENVARRERYRWLVEVAEQRQIRWVATGHTANDQAETVLFRIVRGCGLRGLRGMASCRRLAEGVHVVRPLLQVKRDTIEQFLHERGISARQDSSNWDLTRTRNRIRWHLLPLLQQQYNPRVIEHLCNLAEQVQEWYAWIERQAQALLGQLELPRWGADLVLDAHRVRQADSVLLGQALRMLWEREGWPSGKMTARHWRRLIEFLRSDAQALELPEGIRVHRRLHTWVISRQKSREFDAPGS